MRENRSGSLFDVGSIFFSSEKIVTKCKEKHERGVVLNSPLLLINVAGCFKVSFTAVIAFLPSHFLLYCPVPTLLFTTFFKLSWTFLFFHKKSSKGHVSGEDVGEDEHTHGIPHTKFLKNLFPVSTELTFLMTMENSPVQYSYL